MAKGDLSNLIDLFSDIYEEYESGINNHIGICECVKEKKISDELKKQAQQIIADNKPAITYGYGLYFPTFDIESRKKLLNKIINELHKQLINLK